MKSFRQCVWFAFGLIFCAAHVQAGVPVETNDPRHASFELPRAITNGTSGKSNDPAFDLSVPPEIKRMKGEDLSSETNPPTLSKNPILEEAIEPVKPVEVATPVAKEILPDVDPETLGLLSVEQGGLGTSLWTDTTRDAINRFLDPSVLPTPSRALNEVARRLFLSTAAAPAPSPKEPKNSVQPLSFLAQRIGALVRVGAVEDAWRLFSLAEPSLIDAGTLRELAEVSLLGSASAEVCAKIPAMMAAHDKTEETQQEWQKALLVCQLRQKNDKAVQLGLSLLEEKQTNRDMFMILLSRITSGERKALPRGLTPLRPMTLALLQDINAPLPSEVYARPEASLIPSLIQMKAQNEKDRLGLAERAAIRGLLSKEQLERAYQSYTPTPQEIAGAQEERKIESTGRAMLIQALAHEASPVKKVDLAQKFLSSLPAAASQGPLGQIIASKLETIPINSEMNSYALVLARIFTQAGNPEKALPWKKLAAEVAARAPEMRPAYRQSWPLFVLAGLVPDGDYAQEMNFWLEAALTSTTEAGLAAPQQEQVAHALLLLSAAGYAVPEAAWLRVLAPAVPLKQTMPSPALMERLRLAAQAGRRGEVVLLCFMAAFGGPENAPVSLSVQVDMVRALRLVGLTAEMQALALEALAGIL